MIKLKTLIEGLSLRDAERIFKRFGVDNAINVPIKDLAQAYRKLAIQHHPDRGGNTSDMQDLNAAWDVLQTKEEPSKSSKPSTPKENLYDLNYVKWRAWHMSGEPTKTKSNEYTFWNWDGHFWRGVFTVHITPEFVYETALMMTKWDHHYNSKAVFYSHADYPRTIILVMKDGHRVDPPKAYSHESFNQNPGNDWSFTKWLEKNL